MPFQIVRQDITKMQVDAIVNAANPSLLGGGGVDGAIHAAAGKELLQECRTLGGCETGKAKITKGYRLPAKYVIHTVGPVWKGGKRGERALLQSCYRNALELAKQYECESVAFPLISSGIYGYPKAEALQAAVEVIRAFLMENDLTVYLVIFDRASYQIGNQMFSEITSYIDDHYAFAHTEPDRKRGFLQKRFGFFRKSKPVGAKPLDADHAVGSKAPPYPECGTPFEANGATGSVDEAPFEANGATCSVDEAPTEMDYAEGSAFESPQYAEISLEDALCDLDESFSEMLLRKIDESGMTDAECYRKANIDRKLFSKIRSDRLYRPSKITVIAFGLALELPLQDMKKMLESAGFALSHASKFDVIVEYFIARGNYNVFEINEALFAFDQVLIGA